jgi:subtilisin family serine protease
VAAPGASIRVVDRAGQTKTVSGTSAAAAITSGLLALVWSTHPNLNNRQVVARVLATLADDTDEPGVDDATGYGIVNAYRAVHDDIPLDAPNRVYDQLASVPAGDGDPAIEASERRTAEIDALARREKIQFLVAAGAILLLFVGIGLIAMVARHRRRRRLNAWAAPPSWPSPPYR